MPLVFVGGTNEDPFVYGFQGLERILFVGVWAGGKFGGVPLIHKTPFCQNFSEKFLSMAKRLQCLGAGGAAAGVRGDAGGAVRAVAGDEGADVSPPRICCAVPSPLSRLSRVAVCLAGSPSS